MGWTAGLLSCGRCPTSAPTDAGVTYIDLPLDVDFSTVDQPELIGAVENAVDRVGINVQLQVHAITLREGSTIANVNFTHSEHVSTVERAIEDRTACSTSLITTRTCFCCNQRQQPPKCRRRHLHEEPARTWMRSARTGHPKERPRCHHSAQIRDQSAAHCLAGDALPEPHRAALVTHPAAAAAAAARPLPALTCRAQHFRAPQQQSSPLSRTRRQHAATASTLNWHYTSARRPSRLGSRLG